MDEHIKKENPFFFNEESSCFFSLSSDDCRTENTVAIISWPNRERFASYASTRKREWTRGEGGVREETANENKLLQQFAPPARVAASVLRLTISAAAGVVGGWRINKRWHTYRVNLAQFQRDLIPLFLPSIPPPRCFDPVVSFFLALPYHPLSSVLPISIYASNPLTHVTILTLSLWDCYTIVVLNYEFMCIVKKLQNFKLKTLIWENARWN